MSFGPQPGGFRQSPSSVLHRWPLGQSAVEVQLFSLCVGAWVGGVGFAGFVGFVGLGDADCEDGVAGAVPGLELVH